MVQGILSGSVQGPPGMLFTPFQCLHSPWPPGHRGRPLPCPSLLGRLVGTGPQGLAHSHLTVCLHDLQACSQWLPQSWLNRSVEQADQSGKPKTAGHLQHIYGGCSGDGSPMTAKPSLVLTVGTSGPLEPVGNWMGSAHPLGSTSSTSKPWLQN